MNNWSTFNWLLPYNFNIFIFIKMFRKMLSKIVNAGKVCIVFGSVYFAGCYMYLQEINYRIG